LHRPLHIALVARDRASVDAFYREALAAGGTDNGAPGIRARYQANYYAAFVLDPDGHNIEACVMRRGSGHARAREADREDQGQVAHLKGANRQSL